MSEDGEIRVESQEKNLSIILTMLLVFSVAIAILGFLVDFRDTRQFGGVDLRNRVVGARLIREGLDPYFYEWTPDRSELLLDPNTGTGSPATSTTVTPAALLLHQPVAFISYKLQRYGWFVLQWAMLIATTCIMARAASSRDAKIAIWILGLLIISGSYFWRLHVERGQIYVLYAFMIAVAFWLCEKKTSFGLMAGGFFLGVFAAFRPPGALMLIPMLVYGKWKILVGSVVGAVVTFLVTLVTGNIIYWDSYVRAAQAWSDVFLGIVRFDYAPYEHPVIEGMGNLTWRANTPTSDTSFQALLQQVGFNVSSGPLLIVMFLIIAAAVIFLFRIRKAGDSIPTMFLAGSTLVLLSSYLLPARLYTYNNVMWLIPLALIIISSDSLVSLLKSPLAVLFVAGIYFGTVFWIPYNFIVSDYAMLIYVVAVTCVLLLRRYRQIDKKTSVLASG
ncbi:MAG: glycosyltransferase family 87 protein [Thermoleophilia bacterium]|jgi:hypothetical protein